MNPAPIIIFCYNRAVHLKETVDALLENNLVANSELFIFSDGNKDEFDKQKVQEVRNYIWSISGFKKITIIERNSNWGLANSVIDGVSQIIKQYGKVIVVEDDIITAKYFLTYMNNCLDSFNSNQQIYSISAYCPQIEIPSSYTSDIFGFYRTSSWGWATWLDRWESIDWEVKDFNEFIRSKEKIRNFNRGGMDLTAMLLKQMKGEIDSWAIRFAYACSFQNKLCVYPVASLVLNKGVDGSGTHLRKTNRYNVKLSTSLPSIENFNQNDIIAKNFLNILKQSILRRFINYIKLFVYSFKHKAV